VRYQETDGMGVVYHANYINWFEIGRTELIRDRGYPYRSIEERGLYLPVVDLECKFHRPARYDDLIAIYTRVAAYNALTLEFESQIRRASAADEQAERADPQASAAYAAAPRAMLEPEGELLVSGKTRHVWLNRDWKPARLDRELPELMRLLGDE
jgi:acyl-CoA thioester hydrolase